MRTAAVILAGGASRRMGVDKLALPRCRTEDGTILAHVVQTAGAVAQDVHVAAAPSHTGQTEALKSLPIELGTRIQVHADLAPQRGPLAALQQVWAQVQESEAVFVVAGDLPGVAPQVLQTCRDRLRVLGESWDGVLVRREGKVQPLLGCYRFRCKGAFVQTYREGHARLLPALQRLRLAEIDSVLQGWPQWWTRPVHTKEEYQTWLEACTEVYT